LAGRNSRPAYTQNPPIPKCCHTCLEVHARRVLSALSGLPAARLSPPARTPVTGGLTSFRSERRAGKPLPALFFCGSAGRKPAGSLAERNSRGAKPPREPPAEPPFSPKTPNSQNPHGYWANWANWRELNRQFARRQFPTNSNQVNGLRAKTAASAKNRSPDASRRTGKKRQVAGKYPNRELYQTGKTIKINRKTLTEPAGGKAQRRRTQWGL
jgi:hypothetical protein